MAIEEEIKGIVGEILEDYQLNRGTDKFNEGFDRPNKDNIIEIINKLFRIIYPGYFLNQNYRFYNTSSNLSVQIEDVLFYLIKEIGIALRYREGNQRAALACLRQEAEEISLDFLRTIPNIREYLETDLKAVFDGDPAAKSYDEIILSYPGMLAITIHRIAHELYRLDVPLIPRIMSEYAHSVTGIDIHPGATIGKYFCIDHGTGIVVGETTIIGEHVKLYQGVTIGALSLRAGQKLRGKKRHPTLEDNVTIYAGASILGGDTVIGEGSVIGSNVFITVSIAPDSKVSMKSQEFDVQ